MALSMTNAIRCNDIIEIRMFKMLKVYLLRGMSGEDLVIKIDAVGEKQIRSTGVAAKAIDPAIKQKILTAAETQELKDYCALFEEFDAYYESLNITHPLRGQKDAITNLKQSLSFGDPFVKMPKMTIVNIEEVANDRGQGNKDLVRLFVSTLKGDGGLEMLGHVVAADLFNGNTDRFFPGTNGQITFGPFTVTLKALVNPGNAMLVATNGGYRASLLDYVDPNSRFKDISVSLSVGEKGGPWPGRTLIDRKARKKFAEDIVADLEGILHPKKSVFSMKTKLGSRAADRLVNGMVEGAHLIKKQMEAKYNPNRWTAGTTERYKLICTV